MLTHQNLVRITQAGAPFYLLGTQVESIIPSLSHSRWTGLWGLLFLGSWLASLELLRRNRATGTSCYGLCILWTVMVMLALAMISSLWQIMVPGYKPPIIEILDSGRTLSYLMMIPVGLLVIKERGGRLALSKKWQLYIPLSMGLWYPLSLVISQTEGGLWLAGIYSAVAWSLPVLYGLESQTAVRLREHWHRGNGQLSGAMR
jgi:hypothetical protein